MEDERGVKEGRDKHGIEQLCLPGVKKGNTPHKSCRFVSSNSLEKNFPSHIKSLEGGAGESISGSH